MCSNCLRYLSRNLIHLLCVCRCVCVCTKECMCCWLFENATCCAFYVFNYIQIVPNESKEWVNGSNVNRMGVNFKTEYTEEAINMKLWCVQSRISAVSKVEESIITIERSDSVKEGMDNAHQMSSYKLAIIFGKYCNGKKLPHVCMCAWHACVYVYD